MDIGSPGSFRFLKTMPFGKNLCGTAFSAWRENLPTVARMSIRGRTADSILIVDDTVYVGSRSFRVDDPSTLSIGDTIVVFHPCTDAWVAAVNGEIGRAHV